MDKAKTPDNQEVIHLSGHIQFYRSRSSKPDAAAACFCAWLCWGCWGCEGLLAPQRPDVACSFSICPIVFFSVFGFEGAPSEVVHRSSNADPLAAGFEAAGVAAGLPAMPMPPIEPMPEPELSAGEATGGEVYDGVEVMEGVEAAGRAEAMLPMLNAGAGAEA